MQKLDSEIKIPRKKWFVVYTRSRAEKKVHCELISQDIECFLPLQKKLRQWKDRKKWIEVPLISGYCFVKISKKEYVSVLNTSNVIRYVTFNGKAAVVPDEQIENLKQMLSQTDFDITVTHERLQPGQRVEIISGPMIGLQGELTGSRGKHRFILRINQINSTFLVEVPESLLSILPNK